MRSLDRADTAATLNSLFTADRVVDLSLPLDETTEQERDGDQRDQQPPAQRGTPVRAGWRQHRCTV